LVFRLLAHVPVANVDEEKLHRLLADNPLVGVVDLFAGGDVLANFSVVAAGILPYLLARTLAGGATLIVPHLRELRRRGEQGKKRIELYTKLLTIPISFLFAWVLSRYLAERTGLFPGQIHWFTRASFWLSLWILCAVTAGSLLSTAISTLITKKGIGAGEDVILVAGSSLGFAQQLMRVAFEGSDRRLGWEHLAFALLGGLIVIVYCIYLLQSVRRVPLQYPKRPGVSAGRPSTPLYLPLPLISGRILPATAAIGCLILLQLFQEFLVSHFHGAVRALGNAFHAVVSENSGWHWAALACLILLFTYILNFSLIWQPYTDSTLSIAEQFKREGAFIPGVRPGQRTQEYLSRRMALITPLGAVGLAVLAAGLPYLVLRLTEQNVIVPLLALVVVVETVDNLQNSVQAFRVTASYERFVFHDEQGNPVPASSARRLLGRSVSGPR
jgi:preprotein translocase subunit SecY